MKEEGWQGEEGLLLGVGGKKMNKPKSGEMNFCPAIGSCEQCNQWLAVVRESRTRGQGPCHVPSRPTRHAKELGGIWRAVSDLPWQNSV